jgi:hypothetical protein
MNINSVHLAESPNRDTSGATTAATDIYALADKHGFRFRAPDEEGMQFDKHALLDFADALQTEAYAEGRKDEREESSIDPARHARMDMALRQVFYRIQFEQLVPGSFDFAEAEDLIRLAITTDTPKEPK